MTFLSHARHVPHTHLMAARARRTWILTGLGYAAFIALLGVVGTAHRSWLPWIIPAMITAAIIGVLVQRRLRISALRWQVGADAERVVAGALGGLGAPWRTWHSVSTGRGDLDHLVVGPTGVFVIETKSHRNLDRVPEGMLAQARRGAVWAGRRLRCQAVPVVCLTRTRVHAPRLVDGVWVVNPEHLPRFVRGAVPLSSRDAQRVMRRAARL